MTQIQKSLRSEFDSSVVGAGALGPVTNVAASIVRIRPCVGAHNVVGAPVTFLFTSFAPVSLQRGPRCGYNLHVEKCLVTFAFLIFPNLSYLFAI